MTPGAPEELIKTEWLHSIRNKAGVTFAAFCAGHVEEQGETLRFTFQPQPSDPEQKDADNAKTCALIARVNYLQAKAKAFHTKAKGVVAWTLREKGLNATMTERVSHAFTADFEEESGVWEALSDSLHERLWTGRAEMSRMNRVGE